MAKRIFFSFHYQDIIDFRGNVVRNHWMTKPNRETAGFFDASIWETAKKTSVMALKRLINSGLKNTSKTCILIGSETYNRRWVRYEIFRSIYDGNDLIGVHINKIKGKNGLTKNYGPNPFEYLGLEFSSDGWYAQPREYKISSWGNSRDFDRYKLNVRISEDLRGKSINLTRWSTTYKWIKDDGYNNFGKWVS
ncbi:TIR domain-containing protein [Algibacter agarivorans]|uniref:TIR domain-containing protein n=1 Tax=Algibacter agarivorans TaxID=1109741 RepID=A0ABP9G8M2_9FLAO